MNAGWGLWPRISWNLPDFTLKSGGFHPWNLADFTQISPLKSTQIIKASVSTKTLQFDECRVGDFTLEIQWISPWNLVDFTHEIWQISPRFHLWNPPKIIKASVLAKTLQFDECRVGDFTLEIQWISPWNLVDFTHEIWQISPRFHLWNPPKIIKASVLAKTLQFDECRVGAMTKDFMKSTRFHPEVWWISPMKSGRFHPDFTCEIHPNYKSKCFSKNSSVWWMQGRGYDQGFHEIHQISPWNLVDFTCEIQQSSPRYHLWNPPKIIKASVSAKTLQFDECRVGAMTKDFMKSTGFKSTWNLPDFMKSTGFQNYELLHDDEV